MRSVSFLHISAICILVASCAATQKVRDVPQELVNNAFRCTGGLYSQDVIKAKADAAIKKAELEANVDASVEFVSSLKTAIQSEDVSEELKTKMLDCLQASQ